MTAIALTPIQKKKYQNIKNKTLAERYKVYCLATARIKRREEEAKRQAAKPPNPPKPRKPKPPKNSVYPFSDRQTQEQWREQIKSFKLTRKRCSELKVGDVFKGSAKPYFCEVVEFLPNKDLPPYLVIRLKLLPDNITGEGTFLLPDTFVSVTVRNS